MKAIGHFKTITKHKIQVMKLCFRVGLYKQGLLHDLSKYSYVEFITECRYYQGNRSPNSQERDEIGYSLAWLHHKGRNKHHWEYWVDFTTKGLIPAKMPIQYVYEMFCDRVAASQIYQGKNYNNAHPLQYYEERKHSYIMHDDTRKLLEFLLNYLNENGLEQTISYIKEKKVQY